MAQPNPVARFFVYRGEPIDITAGDASLDSSNWLEGLWGILAIFSGFATLLLACVPPHWFAAIPLVLCAFFIVAVRQTEATYIIHNAAQRIDYARALFGFSSQRPICGFDEIYCVSVRPLFQSKRWSYGVVIVTKAAKVFGVSRHLRNDLDGANAAGRFLADHLGTPFIRGEGRSNFFATRDRATGEVKVELKPRQIRVGHIIAFATLVILIPLLAISAVVFLHGR